VTVQERLVVVLGQQPGEKDVSRWVERAAERRVPLVVLSVGYPPSDSQQRLVAEAIDQAFLLGVRLEAVLVSTRALLPLHLQPGDDIQVVAAPREGRRIGSALGREGS
jgi:hypothetical protein